MSPVGGVGAPGVVGLRRAGVGLGGLRERRQAAAEAPGGWGRAGGFAAGAGPEDASTSGDASARPAALDSRPPCSAAAAPGAACPTPRGVGGALWGVLRRPEGFAVGFLAVLAVIARFESCPIRQLIGHRHPTTSGADYFAKLADKAPPTNSPWPSDSRRPRPSFPTRPPTSARAFPRRSGRRARAKPNVGESPGNGNPFRRRRGPVLGAGERTGQGRAIRCSPPAPASLCSTRFLRRDPPAAGALRSRLALQSAAASAKILRLNADEGALRDLRFAVGDELGPAAKLLALWRDLAGRPPSLDPGRLADAAARLDLASPDPNGLADSLQDLRQGRDDPVSAAAKAAALAFSAFPDAPAAEAEILALWVFDLVLAIRLRWPRPVPLIATKILDPALRSDRGGRRPRPGEPAWSNTAAGGDRARRRLGPRPRRRSFPPRRHPARRRAQTARQTGGQDRRPAARPRIASPRPRRRARRR